MRSTVAVLVAVVAAGCQLEADPTGTDSRAITEGTVTATGDYPETVMLWLGGAMCTGTLVAPQVVLTARHCLVDASTVEVYFGNDPEREAGTWIDAVDSEIHSSTDIGILALETAAPVDPVPVLPKLGPDDIGREVVIVGFGETQGDGATGIKRQGITTISQLQNDVMVVGATGADTCFGDSGGPTFVEQDGVRYLAAVTSSGNSDDCRAGLSFNIRADMYTDWIDAFVREHSCGLDDGLCINDCGQPDPDCLPLGEACETGDDCAENMCGELDGEKLCSHSCSSDDECPEGYECRGDVACWPEEKGGCSSGGRAPAGATLLLLAIALLGLRRRAR